MLRGPLAPRYWLGCYVLPLPFGFLSSFLKLSGAWFKLLRWYYARNWQPVIFAVLSSKCVTLDPTG